MEKTKSVDVSLKKTIAVLVVLTLVALVISWWIATLK